MIGPVTPASDRNSESRHLNPGHLIRVPDSVWGPALARARSEGYRGLRQLIEGWLRAYGQRRLDAIPVGTAEDGERERAARQTGEPPVVDRSGGSHGDTAADLQQSGVEVVGQDEHVTRL